MEANGDEPLSDISGERSRAFSMVGSMCSVRSSEVTEVATKSCNAVCALSVILQSACTTANYLYVLRNWRSRHQYGTCVECEDLRLNFLDSATKGQNCARIRTFSPESTCFNDSSLTFLSLIFTSIKVPRRVVIDTGFVCSLARERRVWMQDDNNVGPWGEIP